MKGDISTKSYDYFRRVLHNGDRVLYCVNKHFVEGTIIKISLKKVTIIKGKARYIAYRNHKAVIKINS